MELATIRKNVPFINPYTVPPQDWLNWAKTTTKYTPDYWFLSQFKAQRVFVPDELMRGHSQHNLLGRSGYYGPTYTLNEYNFWKKDLGLATLPVPLMSDEEPDGFARWAPKEPLRIRGELYLVPLDVLMELDIYKENTVQFIRRRIPITYPYAEVRYDKAKLPQIRDCLLTVPAWMYFGNHSFWKDRLAGMFRASEVDSYEVHNRIWLKKYFFYDEKQTT